MTGAGASVTAGALALANLLLTGACAHPSTAAPFPLTISASSVPGATVSGPAVARSTPTHPVGTKGSVFTAAPFTAGPITGAATAGTSPSTKGGEGSDPFTGRRIVAYYGAPGTAALGILGAGTPAAQWTRLDTQARPYDHLGAPAIRCFEVIAAVAADSPGADGDYRNRITSTAIAPYLAAVRAGGGTLVLDIQPGRSDFLTEAKALQPWLEQPEVGLALDPEWRMSAGQIPGKVIGSVDAHEVNAVSGWLNTLTATQGFPDKLFVVHQFTDSEITDELDLTDQPHLDEILNVDGFGAPALKVAVYDHLAARSPYPLGLKLFYAQDPDLMAPAQVLALHPQPQLIDYQ